MNYQGITNTKTTTEEKLKKLQEEARRSPFHRLNRGKPNFTAPTSTTNPPEGNAKNNENTQVNIPAQYVLTDEQKAKIIDLINADRKSGLVYNPNKFTRYLYMIGISPSSCMVVKKAIEPVEEMDEEETEETVDNDNYEPMVTPILYLNDHKATLIKRIEELNKYTITKLFPKEGLEFLHHPETLTLSKERFKELKGGDTLSIDELAVMLRQVAFNMYSYDKNLAKFLETDMYGFESNGYMCVSVESVHNAMKAALKNLPAEAARINMELLNDIVNHLKEFVKENMHLDLNSIYEIGQYDYEYAIRNINEYNCGLMYGNLSKRYRREAVSQKELTEASADHRRRPILETAKKLKKMKIVDFYTKWKKMTKKQKEHLSSEYEVTKPEPKNLKELDALYNANLISRRTYYYKKNSFMDLVTF